MQRPHSTPIALLALVAGCAATPTVDPLATHGDDAEPAARASAWRVLGRSVEGRPIRARDLGRGERRLAVIAGIHGDEPEGLRHLDALVDLLADVPARVRLIADVNPDGSAAGTRTNARGVDPNRNWPAENFRAARRHGAEPLSEPGVRAAHADLVRFRPELVVVLHSARAGPFVNFDGPGATLAGLFARAAGEDWRVVPDMGYPTPGSFGSWMGVDRGVPTLTIEFRRGAPAEETGPALLRGIAAVLGEGGPAG